MKIFNSVIMASCLFVSSLSASPIFDGTNANLWVVDESGQVSAYQYVSGNTWTLDFSPDDLPLPLYPIQGQDQVLVNNLELSSQRMAPQLASTSIADLGRADLIVGVDNGNLSLGVFPENGSYSKTIKVEIAVDAELLTSQPAPLMLQWEIVGSNTGDTLGSAVINAQTENVDGRLRASFYLVKADNYVVDIVLRDSNGNALASTDAIYDITTLDAEGDQRDTDKDGLPDLVELAIGLDPLLGDWQFDSDGDGWSDFDEWLREEYLDVSGSPLDTDGDGWSDFDEIVRGTEFSIDNQSLQTVSADNPAPEPGTVEYERILQLFRDVPAATRLYEVEYNIPDSVAVINLNTIWQSYSSYAPGGQTIFSSDQLLSAQELAWATVPSADSFERISVVQLKTLKLENRINGLRLPAGQAQVLDVQGIEYKILENAEFSDPSERRTWHSMKWLAAREDASPLTFEPAADDVQWETAEDWKIQFIAYLERYLVQETPVSAEYPVQTIDQKSTTDVTIMLALLSEEFALAGEVDSPEFNQADAMTARVVENLQQALGLRNDGRTLDSVITDLEFLFQNDAEFAGLRSQFESRLNEFPFGTDYLSYLSDLVETSVLLDENENRRLKHLSRIALFDKGVNQLSLNDDLREERLDIDTDGLDNETEILSTIYADSTLPWDSDSDNDSVTDQNDPCPLDSDNVCADILPILSVSSSFTVTRNEEGGYIVVTVQISRIYNQDISVDYTLEDDTAIMGEDFVGMSGTLMIPAGELTASIIINIPPINVENPEESFNLVLSNNQNVSVEQFIYPISIVTVITPNTADATLSGLTVSAGAISPVFASDTTAYTLTTSSASTTITPTVNQTNATVTVNGTAVASGAASASIPLAVGDTAIGIVVTAEDGSTTETYTLIVTVSTGIASIELIDPTPGRFHQFGILVVQLANGNIVVRERETGDSGAVHLYSPISSTPIASIYGDRSSDRLGLSGIIALSNNNYVIASEFDTEGGIARAGSVRLVNGSTGVQIGTALVGDMAEDRLGEIGITALGNNNYVIASLNADGGFFNKAGSVLLVNGSTGVQIGTALEGDVNLAGLGLSITTLGNNNYVITSPRDDKGGIAQVGSVRLVNGNTGLQIGPTQEGDVVGDGAGLSTTALGNNNYVIASPSDDEGGIAQVGSVRLMNGNTGMQIGPTLEGDVAGDSLGSASITALGNNNYVIASPRDNEGGIVNAGSVRLVDGSTGMQIGPTQAGDTADSLGGTSITALGNNNYVIASAFDYEGGLASAGTVRLVDGNTGIQIGFLAGDMVSDNLGFSSITALGNNNYVIASEFDNEGGITGVGSVRLVNGSTGVQIGTAQVGDMADDNLGSTSITALGNNNYVIASRTDNEGGIDFAGSVRLVNGVTGMQIGVTMAGDMNGDQLGTDNLLNSGITALNNNNYVIASERDDEGDIADAGSVRLVDGSTGAAIGAAIIGAVSEDMLPVSVTKPISGDYYILSQPNAENGGEVGSGMVRIVAP